MVALRIVLILLCVALDGFAVWLVWGLLLGPLIFKGTFGADLEEINELRRREECVKMDFDKWYDIYWLNTNKWALGNLPHCRINESHYKNGTLIASNYLGSNYFNSKEVYVNFGFLGNLKYSVWRRRYSKNKKEREAHEKEVKNLQMILESAQSDIEVLKKKSAEEMKKAAETTAKVKENLKKSSRKCYANDPPMITVLDDNEVDF